MSRLHPWIFFVVFLLHACVPVSTPPPAQTPASAPTQSAGSGLVEPTRSSETTLANCESRPGADNELACTSVATGLHYWLYLPESPAGEKLPMILYLHGFSHSGSNLGDVLRGGLPLEIEAGREINAAVVSPQCPSGDIWPSAKMVDQLSELVQEMTALYPVDPQRVTLTGFSMGGDGTWWLGAAHPELFAALAPVASWYNKTGELCVLNEMPIWDFQGENDGIVSPQIARGRARALEDCGGSVKITFYPDADHEQSSRLAYGTDELYEWLLSQAK